MPSYHLVFESPGNAVKEIFIFIDYIRPPLRPAAGAMFYAASALPVSQQAASRPRHVLRRPTVKKILVPEG